MHRLRVLCLATAVAALAPILPCRAGIFGSVRGIVHDPQHRPIQGAHITLRARPSQWTKETETNADGEFRFDAVPLGEYLLRVEHEGLRPADRELTVTSGSALVLHFSLELATVREQVKVFAGLEGMDTASSRTETLVDRGQIERAPGASRTNSLAAITDFVPGAYLVHNQLHLRGGHQATWLVDGVPVPNTNIADTVGPQFDPKDIDTIEIQRGGYSAEIGDRTYGAFNVVPRSGFARDHEAEIIASFGSFNETNSQINFGSHTNRFAWYGSASGNRADFGLMPPVPDAPHNQANGLGAFMSLILNATPKDQLRWVASLRGSFYQVPNTLADQAAGIRDVERERNAFVNFSWVRTSGTGLLLTVSPFYHYSRAAFDSGPNDPLITTYHRDSHYAGGQATLAFAQGRHNARAGVYTFGQHDRALFGLRGTLTGEVGGATSASLEQQQKQNGYLIATFLEEQFRLTDWLTLNGGVRLTHFTGALVENAADPRLGVALRVPKLGWVLRAFYGRYYQAPPLLTVSGPLAEFALEQGFAFLPLRGERDEQHEFGLAIPWRGWVLDLSHFRTSAKNFFDHDALANSNIFLPLTIERARIRGYEATLRSPRAWGRARFYVNYSHQYVQGRGGVSGGLTDFSPPQNDYFFLDHDQRHTLNFGYQISLPWQSWTSGNVSFGSGFLEGDGPAHLTSHTTFSFALGKAFGERWNIQFHALNLTNKRFPVDTSNTFGGTHFNYPRQLFGEVRFRLHY
jgi:hypothetical protein